MIPAGTHKAKAVSATLEKSPEKGTQNAHVKFQLESGETLDWYGYFTEKTEARTIEALLLCGWDGQDFVTFRGVTTNVVHVVVEHETYNGQTRAKIAWVNDPNRTVGGKPMEAAEVSSFADRMRAKVAALKASKGQSAMPGASFDFGANTGKAKFQ